MKAEIKPIKIGIISDDCKFKLPLTRSLPIFPKMDKKEINHVISVVRKYFK